MKINENFLKIQNNYLFSDIAKKVKAYQSENPDADIIRLGIGDVTRPLPEAVISAMKKAVEEMAQESTFRGYPPEWGYDFLKSAINKNDFLARGVVLQDDEIFVSDGAKSDSSLSRIYRYKCNGRQIGRASGKRTVEQFLLYALHKGNEFPAIAS